MTSTNEINPQSRLPTYVAAERLTDVVAERLRTHIVEGHMEPGSVLPSEEALSNTFAVSKRVIRESLRILATQGIVKTAQGKRAVVAGKSPIAIEAYFKFMHHLDRSSVLELYELREIIEARAAAVAAKRATAGDVDRARTAIKLMEEAGDDIAQYVAGDLEFHAALIDAAHNRFLSAVMTALSGALHEEREMGVRNRVLAGEGPRAIREHQAIVDAMEQQDQQLTERRTITHLRSGRGDFESPT